MKPRSYRGATDNVQEFHQNILVSAGQTEYLSQDFYKAFLATAPAKLSCSPVRHISL